MKLATWLNLSTVSAADFAQMAGVSRAVVYKWLKGNIGLRGLAKIQAVTRGRVTPLDFIPDYTALGDTPETIEARQRVAAATKHGSVEQA